MPSLPPPAADSQTPPEILEGAELREAEQADGVAMQRLALERANNQRAGKALADPRRLRQVEIASAGPRKRAQLFKLLSVRIQELRACEAAGIVDAT